MTSQVTFSLLTLNIICQERIKAFLDIHLYYRIKQSSEWSTQTTHEGFICGALSDCACTSQFLTAISSYVDGSSRISSEWITDSCQSGK